MRCLDDRRFDYRAGLKVVTFDEFGDRVDVVAERANTYERVGLRAKRVFIAAGVVPSALIVLASLPALRDLPISIKDSQYFLIPALIMFGLKQDPAMEPRQSLSQIFLEMMEADEQVTHFEIKTYNDFLEAQLRLRLGPVAALVPGLVRHLSRRLVVATGFLHSDHSSALGLRLVEEAGGGRLAVTPHINPAAAAKVRAAARRFRRTARSGGLLALPNTMMSEPGRSFHYGGTFPMMARPRPPASDRLGRPAGLHRVHLVDASVFPTIPATTITLTAMANAHRIASTVAFT